MESSSMEEIMGNYGDLDSVYNWISFESIIPDIIPDEKIPLEPPIWNEEYDEYEDASNYVCSENCSGLGKWGIDSKY